MATKRKLGFEDRLQEVETLIGQMEGGALSLEEAVSRYEAGMRLLCELEKELQGMQQRLTVIRQNESGEDVEEALPIDDEKL